MHDEELVFTYTCKKHNFETQVRLYVDHSGVWHVDAGGVTHVLGYCDSADAIVRGMMYLGKETAKHPNT